MTIIGSQWVPRSEPMIWSLAEVQRFPPAWERGERRRKDRAERARRVRPAGTTLFTYQSAKSQVPGWRHEEGSKEGNGQTWQRWEMPENNLIQDTHWHFVHWAVRSKGREPLSFISVRKSCGEHLVLPALDFAATWEINGAIGALLLPGLSLVRAVAGCYLRDGCLSADQRDELSKRANFICRMSSTGINTTTKDWNRCQSHWISPYRLLH